MSAWIVSKTHIDALVQAGIEFELIDSAEATAFGKMLWQENLNSINARYPDTAGASSGFPGPISFKGQRSVDAYRYRPLNGAPGVARTAPAIVKAAAGCYDYQTCEHDGYDGSEAHKFVLTLEGLTSKAEGRGPWGIDKRNAFTTPEVRV